MKKDNTSFLNSVFVKKDHVQKNNALSEGNIVRVILPVSKIRDLRTPSENSSKILATTSAIQYKRFSRVQKLAVVSWQCVVYQFKWDLCDRAYIGYTTRLHLTRHFHLRIEEHRASAVGAHVIGCRGISNPELLKQFSFLKKYQGKVDSVIRKMLSIREKKPKLNTQSDSIGAKVFV